MTRQDGLDSEVTSIDPSCLGFSLYTFLKIYVYERVLELLPQLERHDKSIGAGVPPADSWRPAPASRTFPL